MTDEIPEDIYGYFQILKQEMNIRERNKAVNNILAVEDDRFSDFAKREIATENDIEILAYVADMIVKKNLKDCAVLILPLLQSSEAMLRSHVCGLLGKCKDEIAVDFLIDRLKLDESVEVRLASAHSLGKIGHPKAIPFLVEASKNDFSTDQYGWSVSYQAVQAIEEINNSK